MIARLIVTQDQEKAEQERQAAEAERERAEIARNMAANKARGDHSTAPKESKVDAK